MNSDRSLVTARYGIDTSTVVRLASGDPETDFRRCLERLTYLVESQKAEIFASNQVIGESYIALQHHYGVTKAEARQALTDVLRSGLVVACNGQAVLDALAAQTGCGLLDRLIANDYAQLGLVTLTLDKRMAGLSGAEAL